MTVSPLQLQMAIACHVSPDPRNHIGASTWESDSGRDAQEWLRANGLVEGKYGSWRGTPRLAAWIDHLCRQPLPEQRWVVDRPQCGVAGS